MTTLGLHRPAPLLLGACLVAVLATACSAGSAAKPPPAPAATRPVAAPAATVVPVAGPSATPAATRPAAPAKPRATAAPRHTSKPRRTAPATPAPAKSRGALADRVSDPQLAADGMVRAWVAGDEAAAQRFGPAAAIELFRNTPPDAMPPGDGCEFAQPMLYVCGYVVGPRAQLTLGVSGGASAGYVVTGVEWGD